MTDEVIFVKGEPESAEESDSEPHRERNRRINSSRSRSQSPRRNERHRSRDRRRNDYDRSPRHRDDNRNPLAHSTGRQRGNRSGRENQFGYYDYVSQFADATAANNGSANSSTQQHKQIKMFKVKPFPESITPTAQYEQWNYWLQNFEMAIESAGDFSQRKMAVELSLHIGEEIRKVISTKELLADRRDVEQDFPFYTDLVRNLTKHFKSLTDESVDVTMFDNIKQGENETAAQFDMRLELLAKRIGETNRAVIKKRLLQGMKDRQLAERAYIDGIEHLEIVKMASRKEAIEKCSEQNAFPWTQPKKTSIIAAIEENPTRPHTATPTELERRDEF